jgi:quinol monooxygenase YgiN
MYARSTTVHGDPKSLDDGMLYVHDKVMPAVQQMDGCVGISMLADRESGRCIVTTSWADAEAMQASAEEVRPIRQRASEIFGGSTEVAEWEVSLMHRMRETGDGACAQVTWTHGDPAATEELIDAFRMTVLPRMEERPGFCSVSLMTDRKSGRAVTAVTYESRAAMDAARPAGTAMREEFLRAMNRDATENAAFDVVLAHLRVPETV